MTRTDNFIDEEFITSYKAYNLREFEEKKNLQKLIQDIPQNSTFDKDAQDRGYDSGAITREHIAVARPQEYFKQWIGRVIEIEDSDNFVAKIESLKNRGTEQKIVRFNRGKVIMANIEQLEEGAVFYWTVGLFQNERKMMVKRSEIRFQMIPQPSPIIIQEMKDEIGKVFDRISWLE